ncbi:Glyoxylate/hydroxypyruvate reductase [Seminavis robusta]|uniref:Glyoxylate/hydroxypyruvate reductase n=1 Tax=Seminavis robusta TaxID=568900 RepID=A0A9N8DJ07_9STRA|nr:Glyoxylate/hydroxypyruvate reductase [Seminavis robusta]|eukprot:Sro170_g075310.1 Glyoxylate/hydroxypyruvate reductase (408) ;mRNA; r:7637-9030
MRTLSVPMLLRASSNLFSGRQTASIIRSSIHRQSVCGGSRRIRLFSGNGDWNRELSKPQDFDVTAPIIREARILSLTDPHDTANDPVNDAAKDPSLLPEGASLLAIGTCLEEFDMDTLKPQEPNVIFVSHPLAREPLAQLLQELPSIEWIHARSAGIDFVASPTLASSTEVIMSNAKGTFSSTLAEYTLMACSYFAKDLPRLLKQKADCNWTKYPVLEVRGATLGIIGYGDIGHAIARLASAYGMKVLALKRHVRDNDKNDPYCDAIYSSSDTDSLHRIFAESDYVVCATPLTAETERMIGREQFDQAKEGSVFINVGRGLVVDEDALVDALKAGKLKGAGLDVFAMEPLPTSSELWRLDNVLLSPHNMDMTETFMTEASTFFVEENLPRFLRGIPLLNVVNKAAGY